MSVELSKADELLNQDNRDAAQRAFDELFANIEPFQAEGFEPANTTVTETTQPVREMVVQPQDVTLETERVDFSGGLGYSYDIPESETAIDFSGGLGYSYNGNPADAQAWLDEQRRTKGERFGWAINRDRNSRAIQDMFTKDYAGLDIYDLGYDKPEFAQSAVGRIKQRGFVDDTSLTNALYADALERVFSLNRNSLGQLSRYDRFGNEANQDFANLALALANLGTTGMQRGAWARSDEYLGYMTQLAGSQRQTFLTVDSARAGRQIATGQAVFGDQFGEEAMRGIQAINQQVQNPCEGFQKTLLYDVIQELFPDTRGDIMKIREAQYDPSKQNQIQQAMAKRIESIYGSVDTTQGFLAFQQFYGIDNPNVLKPLVRQMTQRGGLEAEQLPEANQQHLVEPMTQGNYTPQATKDLKALADEQMAILNQ